MKCWIVLKEKNNEFIQLNNRTYKTIDGAFRNTIGMSRKNNITVQEDHFIVVEYNVGLSAASEQVKCVFVDVGKTVTFVAREALNRPMNKDR